MFHLLYLITQLRVVALSFYQFRIASSFESRIASSFESRIHKNLLLPDDLFLPLSSSGSGVRPLNLFTHPLQAYELRKVPIPFVFRFVRRSNLLANCFDIRSHFKHHQRTSRISHSIFVNISALESSRQWHSAPLSRAISRTRVHAPGPQAAREHTELGRLTRPSGGLGH